MPRGQAMKTPERVAEVIRLREEGMSFGRIAERMGVAYSTVYTWWLDPDGSKQAERHRRDRGTCVDCGGPTSRKENRRCDPCQRLASRIWGRERIITAIHVWAEEHGGIPPAATDWNPAHAITLGHPERAEKFYADDCWPNLPTVQRYFGSWNNAILAAGFEPHVRIGGPENFKRTRELYEAGVPLEEIARDQRCTVDNIRWRLFRRNGST
jgi:hypothetical protein